MGRKKPMTNCIDIAWCCGRGCGSCPAPAIAGYSRTKRRPRSSRRFSPTTVSTILTSSFRPTIPNLSTVCSFSETYLDFVSRLMEQHGIYYNFKHENGKHSLVLVNSNNMHQPVPGLADIPFYPLDREGRGDEERIVLS